MPLDTSHLKNCYCKRATHVVQSDKLRRHPELVHLMANNPLPQSLPRGREVKKLASPFTLHPSLKHKAAFTLAEGATHVVLPDNQRRYAFTLAEVLITLGIIGVVAAMTMPSLILNYKRTETETRLKKAYSTISQAFVKAQSKYGEIDEWPEWSNSEEIIKKYIAPELNGARVFQLKKGTINNMCYEGKPPSDYLYGAQYGWMDKNYISSPFISGETASFQLSDGTCIGLNPEGKGYAKFIFIDINGSSKGPNMAGYDLFFFLIKDNSIKPYGYDKKSEALSNVSTNSCNLNAPVGGFVCAAKIIKDGWKIKYW